jgi:hypothetical protein
MKISRVLVKEELVIFNSNELIVTTEYLTLYTPCPKKTTSVITAQRNFRRQFEVDPPILNLCKVEKNL